MMTPLHLAAAKGDAGAVKKLLESAVDVNVRSVPNAFTPLHLCVSGDLPDDPQRQEIITLLHKAGADLEARTSDSGLSALHLAATRNKPGCVEALIRCGADIHAVEGNGATALHGAAFKGYVEVAQVLLRAGADPKRADKHGHTPLSLAEKCGHAQMHSVLANVCGVELDVDTRLSLAVREGDLDNVLSSLAKGANPNAQGKDGAIALMLAADKGCTEIARVLIEKGADINIKRTDNGAFALLFAAQNGRLDIVRMLLDKGADVRMKGNDGRTALMAASLDGHTEIARLLIEKGAVINESKNDGTTPLMLAAMDGHVEAVRLLIEKGADIHASVVSRGVTYTPRKLAEVKGHRKVVELLEAAGVSE